MRRSCTPTNGRPSPLTRPNLWMPSLFSASFGFGRGELTQLQQAGAVDACVTEEKHALLQAHHSKPIAHLREHS